MAAAETATDTEPQYRSPLRVTWEVTCATTAAGPTWYLHRVTLDVRGREVCRVTSLGMLRDQLTERIAAEVELLSALLWRERYATERSAAQTRDDAATTARDRDAHIASASEAKLKAERAIEAMEGSKRGAAALPAPDAAIERDVWNPETNAITKMRVPSSELLEWHGRIVLARDVPPHKRFQANELADNASDVQRVELTERMALDAIAQAEREDAEVLRLTSIVETQEAHAVEVARRARLAGDRAILSLRDRRIL